MLVNGRTPVTFTVIGVFLFLLIGYYSPISDPQIGLTNVFSSRPASSPPASTNDNDALIYLDPSTHTSRDASTVRLQWNITKDVRAPDGVNKTVYLINGGFPGPTIEARSGDTLMINVHNLLPDGEPTAIHWHGLQMRGANRMDGAVGITQNAIASGESFRYDFRIGDDEAGTFWYHSHSELQRADGLYGGIVVHKPTSTPDDATEHDALVLVGDWYHRSAKDVQAGYVDARNWGLEPTPDSLLLNGVGAFNCSSAVPSRPVECTQRKAPVLGMRHGTHRLRIVNIGAMSGITVSSPSLQMLPVAVDGGGAIVGTTSASSIGVLYPGERVDVIAEQRSNDGTLSIELDDENFTFQNKALTPIHRFPLVEYMEERAVSSTATTLYNMSEAQGSNIASNLAAAPQQNILIYTKMEIIQHLGNGPVGFINRTSWAPQGEPQQPLVDLERDQYDSNQLVPLISRAKTDQPQWVDIVINNLDDKGHPFHLHGYSFYLMQMWKSPGGRYRTYDPFQPDNEPPGGPYNLVNPLKKDTVYIPRMGYVVLRIRADNPGLWFLHCHILWHQGTGMAMVLQVE